MTEGTWVAIIMTIGTTLGAIVAGAVKVVNLLLSQSKDTVAALERERDYWRSLAEQCRENEEADT